MTNEHGLRVAWESDQDADLSWCDDCEHLRACRGAFGGVRAGCTHLQYHEHVVLGCVVTDRHGEVLASLWGITDPDAAYQEEIEGELVEQAWTLIIDEMFAAI